MEYRGGYDTIELSYCADYPVDLVTRFETLKESLIDANLQVEDFCGDWIFKVNGKRTGGGAGPYYAFHLMAHGMDVFFSSNHEGKKSGFYNICVRFGALPLMIHGHLWCFSQLRLLFEHLNVRVSQERLSRIDLAVDIVGLSVERWQHLVKSGAMVTRSHTLKDYKYVAGYDAPDSVQLHEVRGVGTGFSLGRGTMVRVYDKLREVHHESRDKWIPMIEYKWGGRVPEAATRVEIQIRRDWLKGNPFGTVINTFSDFTRYQADFFEYFFLHWFRVLDAPPDRENRHQDRGLLDSAWEEMVFQGGKIFRNVIKPHRVKTSEPDLPDYLFDQLIGVAQAIVAKTPERYQGEHDSKVMAVFELALASADDAKREKRLSKLAQKIKLWACNHTYEPDEVFDFDYGDQPIVYNVPLIPGE